MFAAGETSLPPRELAGLAEDLIETLDQDGAEPDNREPVQANELHLSRDAGGSGGRIKGTLGPSPPRNTAP